MVSGATSRIRRVAASPSCRGISMSITTIVGRNRTVIATPSPAVVAIPTHDIPGTVASARANRSAKAR